MRLNRQVQLLHHLRAYACWLAVVFTCAQPAWAEDISISVEGVNETLSANVKDHVFSSSLFGVVLTSQRGRDRYVERARSNAAQALRPWGYYTPTISANLERAAERWELKIKIDPGQPIRVGVAAVTVEGPGSQDDNFQAWLQAWPLQTGVQLDQTIWEAQKQSALDIAQAAGYFQAAFAVQMIALDLDRHQADLELRLDTGDRAVMGVIQYQQDLVQPHVLAPVARFAPGDPYRLELVEQLRLDLWRTGYFGDIEVIEQRRPGTAATVVDFLVKVEKRSRNTHQGSIGYGTDTRFRTQYNWTRHLLSDRGDSLGIGLGWRQQDSEVLLSGDYRLPRKESTQQFWMANSVVRRENQELAFQNDDGEEVLQLASGQVTDIQFKIGRLRLRNNPWSRKQIAETIFIDLLREKDNLGQGISSPPPDPARSLLDDFLGQTTRSIAVGMEWDWPVIRGSGFATTGHHERAWWFTANEAWGSEKDFSQVYLSSRWNHMLGERWKLLLRGEIGYTDATLEDVELGLEDLDRISVTTLPYRYRFKAGGGQSIRGYDFNGLSNNGIGSNHILVASAELEYQVLQNWSVAAFYDVGNAFNNWSDAKLKQGWGAGLRWYSLIGSVRIDFGRAENIEGNPWQFYLTLGTPLL